ncbi:hypothetical protein BOX15_Mlig031703g1 [Macrostomum lignano]|uniref:Uncharacterized protein n=2 Tax=Macrostomum lignano TaxID=282301 RepID=A0A267EJK0_9PLAT|nr:hypothetical protein BOX15_Mlig031703g1 [Macrostomum lignano]
MPRPLQQLLTFICLAAALRETAFAADSARASGGSKGSGTPVYPVLCDPTTQGCIRSPYGCRSVHWSGAAALGCDFLATWQRAEDGGGDIELAVSGRVGLDGGYIAAGFKPGRGGSSQGVLLACYKTPTDSGVHMRLTSASSGYYFLQASEADDVSLLTEADSAPKFGADRPERAAYFWPVRGQGYATLECRARLRLQHPALDWLHHPEILAHPVGMRRPGRNPVESDGLAKPDWRYTGPARTLSESGDSVGPASTGGAKAHGCLMVLAWVLCASVGMLLARYYKTQWPSRLLGKELAWFQVHRALMASCCILTLISFIVIFADVAGYSALDDLPDLVHPVLGIIVTILTLANPLISLCRCHPDSDRRPWFNWTHWIVGTIAYILAVINLFLGLRLERAGALNTIDYHIWLLIFFVLLQFVIEIILEIHTLYHWRRNKRRWRQYQQDMLDYQQQRQKDAGTLQKPQARPTEPKPAGYCLRAFLLALHVVVATAVSIMLVVVIIVY